MEYDYSALIGFIYSVPEIGSKAGFARYLGISFQAVQKKLQGIFPFSQREIAKLKIDFDLTPDQIDRYFFTVKLLKANIDASKEE